MMETTKWEDKKAEVTLTNSQWSLLTTYILMTTQYRKGEAEAWESLSKETNENGLPMFENAKSNADFYKRLNSELEVIKKEIDERTSKIWKSISENTDRAEKRTFIWEKTTVHISLRELQKLAVVP